MDIKELCKTKAECQIIQVLIHYPKFTKRNYWNISNLTNISVSHTLLTLRVLLFRGVLTKNYKGEYSIKETYKEDLKYHTDTYPIIQKD